jgi:hypothetical protein
MARRQLHASALEKTAAKVQIHGGRCLVVVSRQRTISFFLRPIGLQWLEHEAFLRLLKKFYHWLHRRRANMRQHPLDFMHPY